MGIQQTRAVLRRGMITQLWIDGGCWNQEYMGRRKDAKVETQISGLGNWTGKLGCPPCSFLTLSGNNSQRSIYICRDVEIEILNKQKLVERNGEKAE